MTHSVLFPQIRSIYVWCINALLVFFLFYTVWCALFTPVWCTNALLFLLLHRTVHYRFLLFTLVWYIVVSGLLSILYTRMVHCRFFLFFTVWSLPRFWTYMVRCCVTFYTRMHFGVAEARNKLHVFVKVFIIEFGNEIK